MNKWPRRVSQYFVCALSVAPLVLVLGAVPALGAGRRPDSNRQAQEKTARKACLTGEYATGVSILADLFVEHGDPVYVYNQGRCLEQNTRYKDAIARFEEYLRIGETATLDPSDRESAQKHIEDCKAKLADENKVQLNAPQPFVPPVPQPSVQPSPKSASSPSLIEKPGNEAAPSKSGKGLIVGGIVTGSVGVAAAVAGVLFNLKANSMADEMETKVDAYTASKNSTKESYETAAWVGYGVGAACVATGAVLIAVGASRGGSSNSSDVALVPTLVPGQAGLLLRGGF